MKRVNPGERSEIAPKLISQIIDKGQDELSITAAGLSLEECLKERCLSGARTSNDQACGGSAGYDGVDGCGTPGFKFGVEVVATDIASLWARWLYARQDLWPVLDDPG